MNPPPRSAHRVLVVDDDPAIVKLIERVLLISGLDVQTASTGQEALDAVRTSPPHLVILDVMMPEMNGFEVCRRLKADPRSEGIPVILLTALDETENRVKGIDLGADDYMTKPFHAKELVARVRSSMRTRDLRSTLEESLLKVRRFNAFFENVAMGLDRESFKYRRLEELLIEQVLAGGVPSTRLAALILTGLPGATALHRVRCNAYFMDGSRTALFPEQVEVPDLILDLPHEASVGLRYGPLSAQASADITEALPHTVIAKTGPLHNAAVFMEGSLYIAAFNYQGGVNSFDAELLRGLSLHLSLSRRLSGFAEELDRSFRYVVSALARAAEAIDSDTGNHIVRVNAYAELLAREMGMPQRFVDEISLQAQLHDVGKIRVDPAILRKPGPLDPAEWDVMKSHTTMGAEIIGDAPGLAMGRSIALTHHERWDGSGYPRRLKGEEIPMEGRITAVADAYDAVRNRRAYKTAQDHRTAVHVILHGDLKCTENGFDPRVKEAFRNLERQFDDLYERMR